ncbi:MAG: ABC transporter permease [Clostridiales bacterium]|jgi:multidrug/hemolysin transport system permease protein|nr:ABC transporter permease [Clostridiales bacterium]
MFAIAKRNIKLYFRDKTAVFFSMLGVIIIIVLYALFLGDILEQGITESMQASGMQDTDGVRYLTDSFLVAGIIAVANMTTSLGGIGVLINDRKKAYKDFASSPLKRLELAGGYILSTVCVGLILSLAVLLAGELYIVSFGGKLLSFTALLKVIGIIIISTLMSGSIVFFVATFIKTNGAFVGVNALASAVLGFITGVYFPMGLMPSAIKNVANVFPLTHAASLLRQAFMDKPFGEIFAGAPAEVLSQTKRFYDVTIAFGDTALSPVANIAVIIGTAALFFALGLIRVYKKK